MHTLVFVYGTLKQGHRNATVNQGVRVPGRFVTVQRFPLFVIGPQRLPWLVDRPGQGAQVVGELYRVSPESLARMDLLERITEPDWYARGEIALRPLAEPDAPPVTALVYFGSAGRLESEPVHAGPLAEYTLDDAARHRPNPT